MSRGKCGGMGGERKEREFLLMLFKAQNTLMSRDYALLS